MLITLYLETTDISIESCVAGLICPLCFCPWKHDENFQRPRPGLGWSEFPNERFFLRQFNNDKTITGRQLRLEEEEAFRLRYSSEEPFYHQHLRDFHRLCRGESIVSYVDVISKIRFCIEKERWSQEQILLRCTFTLTQHAVRNKILEDFYRVASFKRTKGKYRLRRNGTLRVFQII